MRSILLSVIFAVVAAEAFAQEIVTISVVGISNGKNTSTEKIVLGQGDVAHIVSAYSTNSIDWSSTELAIRGKLIPLPFKSFGSAGVNTGTPAPTPVPGWVIAGPAELRATVQRDSSTPHQEFAFFTASVTRANTAPAQTPIGAVVIPEDASGSYSVILESSSDMVTWTAANPGTYGGSETRRFFRTRIVRQ